MKGTNTGVCFLPIVDGELIEDEEYDKLPEEIKDEIERKSKMMQEHVGSFMREIHEIDKALEEELDELERNVALSAIGRHVEKMIKTYKEKELHDFFKNATPGNSHKRTAYI